MLFIANWKMQKGYEETAQFLMRHTPGIGKLAQSPDVELVLCPSFVSLPTAQRYMADTLVSYGAQDCSAHMHGAYTGEVSAQSLAELGCRYCIIGHSERRAYHHEDNDMVAQKARRLLENMITPVVCIGESYAEYEQKKTFDVLKHQLKSIAMLGAEMSYSGAHMAIAYEPLWAIGTGVIPAKEELVAIFEYLHSLCDQSSFTCQVRLLYGGSVNPKNCVALASVPHVDGFLIGGASLDFQSLKNIVSLTVSDTR